MKNLNDIVHCLGVSPSRFLSSGSREHGWSVVRGGFLSLAMALTLAACTADSGMDIVDDEAEMPVAFSAYTSSAVTRGAGSPATRGSSVSPSDLQTQGIGVFAFYQKAKSNGYPVNFNKYTGEPTFMYNQKVAYDTNTSSWDYTPHKYWPNNTNDQLSFFAYAPYDVTTAWEDLQLVTNLKGDKFTRHYIIEDEVEDQQDYLWADPILNQLKPTVASVLQFNFRHICSRLSVTCKSNINDSTAYLTIDTVRFIGKFNTSGDYVYLPASSTSQWLNVVSSTSNVSYTSFKGAHRITTNATYVGGDSCSAFVMPGTQDITLLFTITQRNNAGDNITINITKTYTAMQLEEGKAYNFLINVTLTPIEIGTVSVADISVDTEYHNIP